MEWVKKKERFDLDEKPYTKLVCVVSDCLVIPIWLTIFPSDIEDELDVANRFCITINNCYDSNWFFKGNLEQAKQYAFDVVLKPYLEKLKVATGNL
jgi:hypothetical protein